MARDARRRLASRGRTASDHELLVDALAELDRRHDLDAKIAAPEFREKHAAATEHLRREIHRQERRLLRPDGILIHNDGRRRSP